MDKPPAVPAEDSRFTRRAFLSLTAASSALFALRPGGSAHAEGLPPEPLRPTPADTLPPPAAAPGRNYGFFNREEAAFMEAWVDRLIPPDDVGPGALELGVVDYLDRQLAGAWGLGEKMYLTGPFPADTHPEQGYQLPLRPGELYRLGIAEADAHCRRAFGGKPFAGLPHAAQEQVITAVEKGEVALGEVPPQIFWNQVWANVQEGYFADPIYGGNRDMGSWRMLGFPGARADFRADVGKTGRVVYEPVSVAQLLTVRA